MFLEQLQDFKATPTSWWTKEYTLNGKKYKMYDAGGWGGQNIMILPEENMVVIFTGGNYTTKAKPHEILNEYIITAIK